MYDQLVDDDNIANYTAFVQPPPYQAGVFGGTNVKGHMVRFDYSIADALMFSMTCYVNDLINQNIQGYAETQSGAIHAMADMMWKF